MQLLWTLAHGIVMERPVVVGSDQYVHLARSTIPWKEAALNLLVVNTNSDWKQLLDVKVG